MSEISTISEVIEVAITREVQAAQFYMDLSERATDPPMRAFFEGLAQEELRHKARLELEMMKEGVVATSVGKLPEVGAPEYAEELEAAADLDYRDALALAIRKERRSFRLYAELAGVVQEPEMREALLDLAEEESRHVILFQSEYNRFAAQHE